MSSYDADFCAWAERQAAILRETQPEGIDWENVAEELEGMARSERRALESQLERLLIHLLKWRYEPARRGRSWEVTILNARDEFEETLKDSPSLKSKLDESLSIAYRRARREAGVQMEWSKRQSELLPIECEWTLEQVRDPEFWPD
jgi:predicted  nucleic acid-binding Zn-ribbon protein